MNRRSFIGVIGTASLIGLAGCTRPSPTPDNSGIKGHTFKKISSGETPEKPEAVSVNNLSDGSVEIKIQGTVKVRNGCMDLRIGSEPRIVNQDSNRAEIKIESYRASDGICTQAIKPIGYELTLVSAKPLQEVVITQSGSNPGKYTVNIPTTGNQ